MINIPNTRNLTFHHIGVACESITNEAAYWELLGYRPEGQHFTDTNQGIRGQFMTGGGPRIELLESISGSLTLAPWLKRKVKLYHIGYATTDLSASISNLIAAGAGITREPMTSSFFQGRIAFLTLPNLSMIELIETPSNKSAEELGTF